MARHQAKAIEDYVAAGVNAIGYDSITRMQPALWS